MEFLARALTLSSFALLGSAAPAAEASLFNGVVNTANTVGVSVSSVVSAIPKPSTILSIANDAPGATVNAVYGLRKPIPHSLFPFKNYPPQEPSLIKPQLRVTAVLIGNAPLLSMVQSNHFWWMVTSMVR